MTGFIYFFLPECKNIPVEKMEKIWEEHTFCQDMRRDIQEIFKMTPHDKQVMMFSATLSKEIRPVCKKFMQDPMEIYMDDETKLTLHGLVQNYIKLTELEKNRKLNDLLDALDFNQVVIFVKSVNRVAELNKLLVECNFPSICTGTSQEERLTSYKGFKEGHKRILVATDLLGRGIDIERVNIVINYDMLDSADTYLHRVQERFEVDIKELPEQSDTSTYSKRVNLSSTGSPILCYDWILPGGKQQNLGIRVRYNGFIT